MNIAFADAARLELDEVARAYDDERAGLGEAFVDAVWQALMMVTTFPEAGPEVAPGFRRCRVRRFPYHIIYRSTGESIIVLVVVHQHRDPDSWIDRLG